ncbi:tubulin glycylase 3A-like [Phymastichus coffea]|uniref:tubulin glycylase 3A-like n=1 Tax=Phymastichus coffea TaxID=108790 RepID=UPI00273C928A|nr:tubulin glycylase 3A-like [Phymastichus coffea]
MEKHADVKSKSNREHSSKRRQRPQEPPKFYSKNYLRRYNHGEVRASTPTLLTVKKNLMSDQTAASTTATEAAAPTRSQQNEEQNSSGAVIAISPTILKLADASETLVEISKNENPYNRARSSSKPANQQLSDYRYSLLNAMSSVKSSYFKCDALSGSDERASNEQSSLSSREDELARHDTFKKVKAKVEEAIKRHKVFLIRGELPRLKEALEERGWVQKYEPSRTRSLPYGCVNLESVKSLGDVRLADGTLNERALTYALLRHTQPDFIWDCRNDFIEWDRSIAASVLLNRFHKPSLYTSKLGMAHVLQEAHWLYEASVADVLFPRSYNPSRELAAFVADFRRCTTVALLRRFIRRITNTEANNPDTDELQQESTDGGGGGGSGGEPEIPLETIEFAVRRCEEQIAELEHEDIDAEVDSEISEEEWLLFSADCERLLYKPNGMANLPKSDPNRLEMLHAAAQSALEKLSRLDSQFKLNGERNIWIVKPSNLCCGSGIFVTHEIKTIMQRVDSKPRDYYIVQKYIERPLLVHATKFDIRQWFLVTSTFPMTIWTFKEALLRLSSKPYTSTTYHEAIHLCNTAVQERYDLERRRRRSRGEELANDQQQHQASVRDQGWNCEKLNEYLKSLGHEGEPYYERIYPAMSRAIVLTMLAAQDFMDRRRCSFELYGADFMVMDDLSVWLIEINTNPRMHPPSSRITHRLYAAVLDSLVKVVLDLPLNPQADTGGFELTYRQPVPDTQPYLGPCLFAFGKTMTLHEPPTNYAKKRCTWISVNGKQCRAVTAPPVIQHQPKVVDFIVYLNSASSACKEDLEDEVRALN